MDYRHAIFYMFYQKVLKKIAIDLILSLKWLANQPVSRTVGFTLRLKRCYVDTKRTALFPESTLHLSKFEKTLVSPVHLTTFGKQLPAWVDFPLFTKAEANLFKPA